MHRMLGLLARLMFRHGWIPEEIVHVSEGTDASCLPGSFDPENIMLVRPEHNLLSAAWRGVNGAHHLLRFKARRDPRFIKLADLLQPHGHFPLCVLHSSSSLDFLPEVLRPEDVIGEHTGQNQAVLVRWDDDEGENREMTVKVIKM